MSITLTGRVSLLLCFLLIIVQHIILVGRALPVMISLIVPSRNMDSTSNDVAKGINNNFFNSG